MNAIGLRVGLFVRDVIEGVALRFGRFLGIHAHDRVVLQYGPWCRRNDGGGGPLWCVYTPDDKGIDFLVYMPSTARQHGDVIVVSDWYDSGTTWVLRVEDEVNGIASQRMYEKWETQT